MRSRLQFDKHQTIRYDTNLTVRGEITTKGFTTCSEEDIIDDCAEEILPKKVSN